MDLEGDEAGRSVAVLQVGGGHGVDPSLDGIAPALDAKLVPVALFEGLAGGFVVLEVIEPAAPTLVVNAAAPRAGGGIDFDLVAMHATGGDFDGLALPLVFLDVVKVVTAKLDA